MPAPRMMMRSSDISAYTGMCIADARYLIMKFERDGKILLKRKRNKLVDVNTFSEWYAHMFDRNEKEVRAEVREWLRQCAAQG